MKVATGLATGSKASPELAAQAVRSAMEKAGINAPSSVLLFLTSEFASDPQSAIRAAASAASCTQIIGCSASGIFTEEDWVLDSPAAAAMVFDSDSLLKVADDNPEWPCVLTLAAPNAINSTWLDTLQLRFGGVSGDATGHGAFSVWQNGKGVLQGYCSLEITNTRLAVAASHGLRMLSSPRKISKSSGHDVITLAETNAYGSLAAAWAKYRPNEEIAFHQLVAIYAPKAARLERGEYRIATVAAGNQKQGTVTLSQALKEGEWLSWALRDTDAAQVDIVKTASDLKQMLPNEPAFAILFSCLGRGPYFYNGTDKDLALLNTLFPGLPIIGFYGNGEIAPINGINELLQYSAVLALFSDESA
jgi:small ligand-binding sensory domain FIST